MTSWRRCGGGSSSSSLGPADASGGRASARTEPSYAPPAPGGGGDELRSAARRDAARACDRVPPAQRLLHRGGRVPARLRGGFQLQPGVPPLDRQAAERASSGTRSGALGIGCHPSTFGWPVPPSARLAPPTNVPPPRQPPECEKSPEPSCSEGL